MGTTELQSLTVSVLPSLCSIVCHFLTVLWLISYRYSFCGCLFSDEGNHLKTYSLQQNFKGTYHSVAIAKTRGNLPKMKNALVVALESKVRAGLLCLFSNEGIFINCSPMFCKSFSISKPLSAIILSPSTIFILLSFLKVNQEIHFLKVSVCLRWTQCITVKRTRSLPWQARSWGF